MKLGFWEQIFLDTPLVSCQTTGSETNEAVVASWGPPGPFVFVLLQIPSLSILAKAHKKPIKTSISAASGLTKVGKCGMLFLVMIEVRRDQNVRGFRTPMEPQGSDSDKKAFICGILGLCALRSRGLMLGFGHRRHFPGLPGNMPRANEQDWLLARKR